VWQSLTVRGFQSLADVEIELGDFTAIVGPSSSGKSALVRSIKAVCSNLRGTGFVTHGMPGMSISIRTADGQTVSLEKGVGVNGYRVSRDGQQDQVWTKLAGAVPDEISAALGVPAVAAGSTWFAGQFDGPYLLADSGSQIAQVLGGLSGVGVLRNAAREGARRSLEQASAARSAAQSVDRIRTQAQEYADLPQRRERVSAAARELAEVAALQEQVDQAVAAVGRIVQARQALAELPPEVPERVRQQAGQVGEAVRRVQEMSQVVARIRSAEADSRAAQQSAEQAGQQIRRAQGQYQTVLQEAGVCPVCKQTTGSAA